MISIYYNLVCSPHCSIHLIRKSSELQQEEWIDKGNAKEKYKGKENGSKIMTWWQKVLCWCHYGPALWTFWFQTDLGRENSATHLKIQAEKTEAFHFSHHSHALVTLYVQFLRCDWSKSDRWVHVENLYSILKLVMFLTVFFHWMHKNEIQLLSTVFCYSWLVCLLNFWLRNAPLVKVGNPIRMTSFSFFSLLDAPWKVPQAILALLDSFQELHLEW